MVEDGALAIVIHIDRRSQHNHTHSKVAGTVIDSGVNASKSVPLPLSIL